MPPWSRHLLYAVALLLMSTTFSACADDVPTQVLVEIDADALSRTRAEFLRVRVFDTDGQMIRDQRVRLKGLAPEATFVATVPVAPADTQPGRRFTVEAELIDAQDMVFATLSASGNYVASVRATLRLQFDERCHYRTCENGFTCEPIDCADRNRCLPSRCVEACYDGQFDTTGTATPVACENRPQLDGAFVDSTEGNDENECDDPETPCASIRAALDRYLATGLKRAVYVAGDGARYGKVVVTAAHGGTAAALHSISAWPGRDTVAPIIDANGAVEAVAMTSQFITLEGFDLQGGQGHGVDLNRPAVGLLNRNVTIRGNRIHDNGFGMQTYDFNAGVTVVNAGQDNLVIGNVIHDNRQDEGRLPAAGIWVANGATQVTGTRVIGNRITGNEGPGLRIVVSDVQSRFNFFVSNGGDGIEIFDAGELVSDRDVACDNERDGASAREGGSLTVSHGTWAGNQNALSIQAPGTTLNATQNILVGSEMFGVSGETSGNTISLDGNLYFGNTAGARSAGAIEANATEGDPLLQNLGGCDLFPTASSPAFRGTSDPPLGAL